MANYYTEAEKAVEKKKKELEAIAEIEKEEANLLHDEAIQNAQQSTALGIKKEEDAYRDIVDTAAIQKELDKRRIAETMENMGLSRSGLNATQQTAIELSVGNRISKAQLQKQNAIDTLNRELAAYKVQQEDSRRAAINSIDRGVAEAVADTRDELTKEAMNLEQKDVKAAYDYNIKLAEAAEKKAEEDLKTARKWKNRYYSYRGVIDGVEYYRVYDPDSKTWSLVDANTIVNNISSELDATGENPYAATSTAKKMLYRLKNEYSDSNKNFYNLSGQKNSGLSAQFAYDTYKKSSSDSSAFGEDKGYSNNFVSSADSVAQSVWSATLNGEIDYDYAASVLNDLGYSVDENGKVVKVK